MNEEGGKILAILSPVNAGIPATCITGIPIQYFLF